MARKPNSENPITPLAALLRECSREERERLALLAGTTVNYLYSIAGCHRPNTSAATAVSIEDATRALHAETKGRTQIITVREIATMCQLAGF